MLGLVDSFNASSDLADIAAPHKLMQIKNILV
jgi:hypothetical protein